ncbi:MAG: type II toxin-antitoxin system RelE/ParE family toxin [Candidatus Delongbacteria bacterium]|nr:type II toxin-antitoxin system RelE/ParE family toxin [Candidatus Delongbacteria bacterium]
MEIRFTAELEKLYVSGTMPGSGSRNKLDKRVIDQFFEVTAILEAANDIYDLWHQPSLHFEHLQGRSGTWYSARLDRKWRLEMTIEWTNDSKTIGIISLEHISNHYR